MIRSLLYVPASSERFIAKAHERGADAVILDLEDAVVAADKAGAQARLAEAVSAVGRNGAKVFVRINADPALMLGDAEAACRAGGVWAVCAQGGGCGDAARAGGAAASAGSVAAAG
ncbi:aldolase/citrate lyase family protein [Devosia sp. A8/3-2]|nr:aldolase/citrate lyase family protein [Devosia sp. A8/3-2]